MRLIRLLRFLFPSLRAKRKPMPEVVKKPIKNAIKQIMETKTEVKTYQVDYLCPKCKEGYLRPIGGMDGGGQPHKCNNYSCTYAETMQGKVYPYRITELVANEVNG